MKKHKIWKFFDKLEDEVRGFLSKFPIVYAFFGGVSIVLFWRGVWHTADTIIPLFYINKSDEVRELVMILEGPINLVVATLMLMVTGLLVNHFIGNEIIISGIKHEKKLEEKEAEEIETEEYILHTLSLDIKKIQKDIKKIKEKIK